MGEFLDLGAAVEPPFFSSFFPVSPEFMGGRQRRKRKEFCAIAFPLLPLLAQKKKGTNFGPAKVKGGKIFSRCTEMHRGRDIFGNFSWEMQERPPSFDMSEAVAFQFFPFLKGIRNFPLCTLSKFQYAQYTGTSILFPPPLPPPKLALSQLGGLFRRRKTFLFHFFTVKEVGNGRAGGRKIIWGSCEESKGTSPPLPSSSSFGASSSSSSSSSWFCLCCPKRKTKRDPFSSLPLLIANSLRGVATSGFDHSK